MMQKIILFSGLLLLSAGNVWASKALPFEPIKNLTNPDQQIVREQMLEAIDESWKSFENIHQKPFDFPETLNHQTVKESLEKIFIDKVQFKNTSLNHIIQYFMELAAQNQLTVNIFVLGTADDLKLNFNARGVNFWRALELLSVIAGLQMDEDEGVIFLSKVQKEEVYIGGR